MNAINEAELAKYVKHRRVILELLAHALRVDSSGKYVKEEYVHQLLCPMRKTSDDIGFHQNLWVIDEKLTYHDFLASDLPLWRAGVEGTGKGREPDILWWDKPISFVQGDRPFQSVVVVELKKPERNEYSDDDNPIQQVKDYINLLRARKLYDGKGQLIGVPAETRFFVYILASLTPKILRYKDDDDWEPLLGGGGFFRYHKTLTAYMELLGYDKLYDDAMKRNRVLFRKLGIPDDLD